MVKKKCQKKYTSQKNLLYNSNTVFLCFATTHVLFLLIISCNQYYFKSLQPGINKVYLIRLAENAFSQLKWFSSQTSLKISRQPW